MTNCMLGIESSQKNRTKVIVLQENRGCCNAGNTVAAGAPGGHEIRTQLMLQESKRYHTGAALFSPRLL